MSKAEVFHPSVFIREEMRERKWSLRELARRMGTDPQITVLGLHLYFKCGPTEPNLRLGNDIERLARAFGSSADYWRNLEKAWVESQAPAPAHDPSKGEN